MKTLNIASTLTNINDLYIDEAAEMPYEAVVIPMEKRRNGFVRFINSGWGVAMLCALVAVAVTLGILAAGRAAGPVTTLPGAGPTHPTFSFDYGIEDEQALYMPGDRIRILTKVTNLGMPFTVTGSSQAFSADAWLVPHGSEDVYAAEGRINGLFAYCEDYVVQTIEQGRVGKHSGLFTIPEDAMAGTYDLVLSYKEEYQVFENAVTIVRTGLPVTGDVSITVFPNLSQGVYVYGETVTIDFMVDGINHLYPSSSTTSEGLTALNYSIEAILTPHGQNVTDPSAITGEVAMDILSTSASSALSLTYWDATFVIPEGATEGSYDLYLFLVNTKSAVSFDLLGHSVTENMLTVKGTHSRFDFHYSIVDGTQTFERGKSYEIATAVTNLGEPFTITGSSMAFSAEAKLVHHDDPEKVIQGEFFYDEDVVTQEITTGQIGRHQGYFTIPEDAATGEYDLWLHYGDESEIFEGAITVIDPTVLPPLSTVNDYEEASTERLKGFTYVEFIQAWGRPQAYKSDTNVFYWRVPNQASYDYVAVRFDENHVAKEAEYAYVMKTVVKETCYEDNPNSLLIQPYGDRWEYYIYVSLHNTSAEASRDTIDVGTVLYVTYRGGINETAPCHFAKVIDVTLEPPVP